eukprot:TRINITY_DN86592_c0_g1_i1.p1 TRINITY_DN86592_c0_g1~~TRINITY_DN86592_c0_g1_i1.p1  ORF type:complete len:398 (-),score=19.03 TRINITY_DN86592_c0_g1_i1:64-1257(-)
MRRYVVVSLLVASVAILGTANNFASKIKSELVGKEYNFVCILPDSILQFLFYAVMVCILSASGAISSRQFSYVFECRRSWDGLGAWKFLALAGMSDIANNVTGLMAQPYLTAFMMSLMDQATTPFTVFFSALLLRVNYAPLEVGSVLVVVCAAIYCVILSGTSGNGQDSEFWAVFAAATTSFAALSFVLKEITFINYKAYKVDSRDMYPVAQVQLCHTGPPTPRERPQDVDTVDTRALSMSLAGAPREYLNVFLVGAVIQTIGLMTAVPIALITQASVHQQGSAWQTFVDGLHFLCINQEARNAYAVYIVINTAFNLALILTTSYGSALLSFLSLKAAVPLTAIFSAVHWPVIGAKPLNSAEWLALGVLISGLVCFRMGNIKRERRDRQTQAEQWTG